jgi:hypothetical protein
MNSSSKKPKDCNNTFICIWKSPNTDNVVKDNDYDNGKYVDYVSQSILAKKFYDHIKTLPCYLEIPESNLTINPPKDDHSIGVTNIKFDKSNKAVIQLSHTFCYSILSSINIDYLIPKKTPPGYLVMVFFGQDSKGNDDIISVLRFHFEPLFLSENVNGEYPMEAHLDGFCGNCDNPNIKGAGIGINIFFDYCKKWNETNDNQIIQYRLEAVPRAFNYWKHKFGFIPDSSDLNDDELIPMTKPGPIIMEEVVVEPPVSPMETSVPTFTNEQMETIDWAVTWDELVEGLEQEMRHQEEEELNRGMSASHRQAWGDDEGFEHRGSLRKSKRAKSKRAKSKRANRKTKHKKSPRRGRRKPTGSSSI